MKCIHCEADIVWNPDTYRWENETPQFYPQYCWIDPELGSQLHDGPAAQTLTPAQKMEVALRNIANYPTKSTDPAVLSLQRMAQEALS